MGSGGSQKVEPRDAVEDEGELEGVNGGVSVEDKCCGVWCCGGERLAGGLLEAGDGVGV